MKILITGGSGFIARNLKKMFEDVGHSIISPSRSELDITNLSLVDTFLNKNYVDGIIHTAVKGGDRGYEDTQKDFSDNILMFENLINYNIPIVIYGSGASFDRRYDINEVTEEQIFKVWPIDLYGLAKNIIARRIMSEPLKYKKIYLLNIFNCFNHDEECTRFIKRSITNIKNNIPIEIYQNKKMDFFYFDDLFTLTQNYLSNPDINSKVENAVYTKKFTLLDIANIISNNMLNMNPKIQINLKGMSNSYTGNGTKVYNSKLNLIGLEEGIKKTINKLI
jgi:GDP-L-fucose synthase